MHKDAEWILAYVLSIPRGETVTVEEMAGASGLSNARVIDLLGQLIDEGYLFDDESTVKDYHHDHY